MPRPGIPTAGADQKGRTRLQILDTIRTAGRIARTDIARLTRISPATVSAATSDMLAAGLIDEVAAEPAPGAGRRGRPRVMLKLRGPAHIVAGLKVARRAISVLLVDFEGAEIVHHIHPLERSCMTPEALAEVICAAVAGACAAGDVAMDALSGVSVGLAGQVDAGRGLVHWSSSLIGRNHAFGPLLADRLPCPVFIENDANLVAKAEQLFGLGRGVRNFLTVTIEHGVGLGIVLDGRLHRGARGCAAEFGHTKIARDGALCQCGQRGCLEAYVGDYALLRDFRQAAGAAAAETVGDVFAAAERGNPAARSVLDRAGRVLGTGLANLINLFDPELIILSGAQIAFEHLHSDAVGAHVRANALQVDAPLPGIRVHRWGDVMWAKGAAAHGIGQVSIQGMREMGADVA